MKKILTLVLALLLAASLFACNGNNHTTTDADTTAAAPESTDSPESTAAPESTQAPETTDAPETTNTPEGELAFTDANETVYVHGTDGLNIRESHSLDSKGIGSMREGESLVRTGVATIEDEDGILWSRVSYYGKTAYASSEYLTTAAPFEFTNESATVYVTTDQLNLRAKPSPAATILVSLKRGDKVERTGVSTTTDEKGNQWSRLLHNGVVCYANSTYLSTQNPSPSVSLTFEEKADSVYIIAHSLLNLRAEASMSSTIVASLGYGEKLERIGLATAPDSDGVLWSRVMYNDKVCYVGTAYLSTEKTVSFTDANEKVYITASSLYMRDIPSLSGSKLLALPKATELMCTGKATEADTDDVVWFRVVYNNETYYAGSAYLSTERPE